jgi:GxxExxY protein
MIKKKVPDFLIEKALIKELALLNLKVSNQERIEILYKGEKIGVYVPDIVVNNSIIIELKSKPFLTQEDEKQFWGYLKGSEYKLGFLINFEPQKLVIKRFVHSQKLSA